MGSILVSAYGRNFGLTSGGTNSEGEQSALGLEVRGEEENEEDECSLLIQL